MWCDTLLHIQMHFYTLSSLKRTILIAFNFLFFVPLVAKCQLLTYLTILGRSCVEVLSIQNRTVQLVEFGFESRNCFLYGIHDSCSLSGVHVTAASLWSPWSLFLDLESMAAVCVWSLCQLIGVHGSCSCPVSMTAISIWIPWQTAVCVWSLTTVSVWSPWQLFLSAVWQLLLSGVWQLFPLQEPVAAVSWLYSQ